MIQEETLTIDDFELIKELDKGAYGNVWLSKQIKSGQMFAIKIQFRDNKHVIKMKEEKIMEEFNIT